MRSITTAKPKVFVIENVDRFSQSPEFQMLLAEIDHGLLSEYEITHDVLNAATREVATTQADHHRRVTAGQDRTAQADPRTRSQAWHGHPALADCAGQDRGIAGPRH